MQTELNKVVTALVEFYAAETYLLERDLGERTLTHRLAVYVEKQFPGWQVDCNYDRLGERMLRMPHGTIISSDDHLGKSVYPDIVVTSAKFPTICWRSRCARRPAISRSSTISTSWPG